jgi:hypothetical protein
MKADRPTKTALLETTGRQATDAINRHAVR